MVSHIKRAVKDIRDNGFVSSVTVITVALLVLMVSAFILFLDNTGRLMQDWRKGIRIMVYLEADTAADSVEVLGQKIRDLDGIKEVHFISKQQALEILKEQMKRQDSILDNLDVNPLPDAFEIIIGGGSSDDVFNFNRVEALVYEIKTFSGVDHVEYGKHWLERFSTLFDLFRLIGYVMGGIFIVSAIFIVGNTIRLVVYTRRDELHIMRLVGAYDRFIKMPFYLQALIQSGLGALIAIVMLYAGYAYLVSSLEKGFLVINVHFLSFQTCTIIIISSMLLGMLGCFVSLRQFLKD